MIDGTTDRGPGARSDYVRVLGEDCFRIADYDRLPPFFMTLVGSSDHWLFASSTGGVTAGRVEPDYAVFPYYTEDKVADGAEYTGPKAIFRVRTGDGDRLWEPFSLRDAAVYRTRRNLYKNREGSTIAFEEINEDLGLSFLYAWRTSDRYGIVKTSRLAEMNGVRRSVELLDGFQNIIPSGAYKNMQETLSVLLDAYKRSELLSESGLAVFSLSSSMTDMAEASESLAATVAFQLGLEPSSYLLSSRNLDAFRRGEETPRETDVRGERGAYLVRARLDLGPREERIWHLVVDADADAVAVADLARSLEERGGVAAVLLEKDIEEGRRRLVELVAAADGLQESADESACAHHFANAQFNIMRGGVFAEGYSIRAEDFADFVRGRNAAVAAAKADFLAALPALLGVEELLRRADGAGSADLERLGREYLPLTFGRRHGDPSRPWNSFAIRIKNPDGSRRFDYQGNWRDIFQNWEALSLSFPLFLESMIARFLNAVTPDGYNPYRVTKNGIDWEIPEPDSPWSNIGYWSDHQIVYLGKLLEAFERVRPGRLAATVAEPRYSSANIPYRIKAYAEILADPGKTIAFDYAAQAKIEGATASLGGDGKLVRDADGNVVHVSAAEKLLVLTLAKLSNFVPGGGIWMNTQRPEWNDGNNALVGKGLSVVTACQLLRFVRFCAAVFDGASGTDGAPSAADAAAGDQGTIAVDARVAAWFADLDSLLRSPSAAAADEKARRAFMDAAGEAGGRYRASVYGAEGQRRTALLSRSAIAAFFRDAATALEATVRANRREDGLYHSYNVLSLQGGGARIGRLDPMLEGQVAVLSALILKPAEALDVLRALRASAMYRRDQNSYMLYPDRDLPGFLAKNAVKAEKLADSALAAALERAGDRSVLGRDGGGTWRFGKTIRNAEALGAALDALAAKKSFAPLVEAERESILELYEETFDHAHFTGRSGTFFAYEGLGSIYWHMVSKLLLAGQEAYFAARSVDGEERAAADLADAYYGIRSGLGFNKSPETYGAFPNDPYSHTPGGKGARQPGMTGQVKEEVLTRFGELGVVFEAGRIAFRPALLKRSEFLSERGEFSWFDRDGRWKKLPYPARSLAFTCCGAPVLYREIEPGSTEEPSVEVRMADGTRRFAGEALDEATSLLVFERDCAVEAITVRVRPGLEA